MTGPTPALHSQNLHFHTVPRRLLCTFEFEKHFSGTHYFLASKNALKTVVTSFMFSQATKEKRRQVKC